MRGNCRFEGWHRVWEGLLWLPVLEESFISVYMQLVGTVWFAEMSPELSCCYPCGFRKLCSNVYQDVVCGFLQQRALLLVLHPAKLLFFSKFIKRIFTL